jgi:hypothetical protein
MNLGKGPELGGSDKRPQSEEDTEKGHNWPGQCYLVVNNRADAEPAYNGYRDPEGGMYCGTTGPFFKPNAPEKHWAAPYSHYDNTYGVSQRECYKVVS